MLAGWCAAGVGMAAALVQTRISVRSSTLEATVPAWSGPVLLIAGAGLVVAAAIGAEGARARLAAIDFGWRQPVALLLTVVAGLVPVLAAGWWLVNGADNPLGRRDPVLLPAFIAAEGAEPDQPRTLVLRPAQPATGWPTRCCGPTVRASVTPRRPPAPTGAPGSTGRSLIWPPVAGATRPLPCCPTACASCS